MKATFFAAIVVFESLGHAVGDPSMQQIFASSLKLPEFWWALPFFTGAVSTLANPKVLEMDTNMSGTVLLRSIVFNVHPHRWKRSRPL